MLCVRRRSFLLAVLRRLTTRTIGTPVPGTASTVELSRADDDDDVADDEDDADDEDV